MQDRGQPGATNGFISVNTFEPIDTSKVYAANAELNASGVRPTGQVPLSLSWQTASDDGFVAVQVDGSSAATSYIRLFETSRGSGVFVSEVRLVANTNANSDTYENGYVGIAAGVTATVNVVTVPPLDPNANPPVEADDQRRIVDGRMEQVPLPVGDGGSVTFRYRDKTGEASNGDDQATTRSTSVAVEINAPTVTITAPEDEAATSSRRPSFEGNALDGGGSGLLPTSLRLVIDNRTTSNDLTFDTDGRVSNVGELAFNPRDAIGDTPGTNAYFDSTLAPSSVQGDNIRVLSGAEDVLTGLYAANTDYQAGRDDVVFRYTPSSANILLSAATDLTQLDQQVDFQAYIYDLAGNVGISDADEDSDGLPGVADDFRPHVIEIDGKRPGLVDTESDGFADIEFDNTDIRVYGSTQSGLSWNRAEQVLEISNRHIMVVFDDPVIDIAPEDVRVDYPTGFTDPSVVGLILPTDATADDPFFADAVTNTQITNAERTRLIELLGRSAFIELSADIPPEIQPSITVSGVQDAASNSIDPERDTEPANDGLGPTVSVSLSGGSGVGGADDETGPNRLTNGVIIVTITSDEEADRPSLGFYQESGRIGTADVRARLSSRGTRSFEYQYRFASSSFSGAGNGVVCVVATVRDSSDNTSTRGVTDCNSDDAITFTLDVSPPTLTRVADSAFDQRPLIQIRFDEVVQPDSVEVRLNGDDVPNSRVSSSDNQVFAYEPAADLDFEVHAVEVKATDFAGNETSGFLDLAFTVSPFDAYEFDLERGWNLISFPSDPINPDINSVFSNDAVQVVATFDAANFRNGNFEATRSVATGRFTGSTGDIRSGLAYWVYSNIGLNDLEVELQPPLSTGNRNVRPSLTVIPTIPGVNFVGVVDATRQQATGESQGDVLNNGVDAMGVAIPVTVADYFGDVRPTRIYRYDDGAFVALENADTLLVGEGLLVYLNPDSSGRTAPIVP